MSLLTQSKSFLRMIIYPLGRDWHHVSLVFSYITETDFDLYFFWNKCNYTCSKFWRKFNTQREQQIATGANDVTTRSRDKYGQLDSCAGFLYFIHLIFLDSSEFFGNSLDAFCLFRSTQLGRFSHFNSPTTLDSSNRMMVFLTSWKCSKGGNVMYWNNAYVEDRWTSNLTSNALTLTFKYWTLNYSISLDFWNFFHNV